LTAGGLVLPGGAGGWRWGTPPLYFQGAARLFSTKTHDTALSSYPGTG